MALIGEIRKRSWLLVAVIILALLTFILGDFINKNRTGKDEIVGKVGDFELKQSEYSQLTNARVQQYSELYKKIDPNNGMPSGLESQINQSYLNEILNQKLFENVYENLGIKLTDKEFNRALHGDLVNPQVYQNYNLFLDQTRQFSMDSLNKNFENLYKNQAAVKYLIDNFVTEQVKIDRMNNKLNNLLSKALYTTSDEAKAFAESSKKSLNFNFVFKDFASINDKINISNEEIKSYYEKNKHQERFKIKQDLTSFSYVEYPLMASFEDINNSKLSLEKLKERFSEAENDTIFVKNNTFKFDEESFQSKMISEFQAPYDTIVKSLDTGEVFGPYMDKNFYKLSKLVGTTSLEQAKASHILLNPNDYGSSANANKFVDSLIKIALADKSKFGLLAIQHSKDQGSAQNGGELGWFEKGKMVPEFENICFSKAIGGIYFVQTKFGVHIIYLQDRKSENKLVLATITSEIKPSSKTIDSVMTNANKFLNKFNDFENVTIEKFTGIAKKEFLEVKKENALPLNGDKSQNFQSNIDKLKTWAFNVNTKKGSVSRDAFLMDDKVLVTILQSKSLKGDDNYEAFESYIRLIIERDKKMEIINKKIKSKDLVGIATDIGVNVDTASNINLAQPAIQTIGYEPFVVNYASTMKPNTVSKTLKGTNGIFVVKLNNIVTDSVKLTKDEIKMTQERLKMQKSQNVFNEYFQSIIYKYEMEDRRDRINYIEYSK